MGARVTRGRTGCWVASRLGEKRPAGKRAGWLAGLRGALAGPMWEAETQGGLLRWLQAAALFLFF